MTIVKKADAYLDYLNNFITPGGYASYEGINEYDARTLIAEGRILQEMRASVHKDKRYTKSLEYCGYATPRIIARFCGEWIGQSETEEKALNLCFNHRYKYLRGKA